MSYFIKTVVGYLLLFGLIALGIQMAFERYYMNEMPADTRMSSPTSLTFGLPSLQPRETETGLLLSGIAAQNRRDWAEAWQNFSRLNEKYDSNPDFALRAFTLALGNGEYKKAEDIAVKINNNFLTNKDAEEQATASKYDLVRLFLTFQSIDNERYQEALDKVGLLQDGALAAFSQPILENWMLAEINPDEITASSNRMNPLQLYYKALAADYAKKPEIARQLMDKVNVNVMTPEKIETIAAFYVRQDNSEKAIDIVRRAMVKFSGNENLGVLLADLQADDNAAALQGFDEFHFHGSAPAIAAAYHDFSLVMLSEGAVDSTLLFARMAAYLNPYTEGVYLTIADVLKFQGQTEQALQAYAQIRYDDDNFERAVAEQHALLIEMEDFDRAETTIRNALNAQSKAEMDESPYFYFLLGNVKREQKDYKKALEAYNKAEQLGIEQNDGALPQTLWPVYYARAVVYDITDEWGKAEEDLLVAMEKFPNSPIILNYLGYAYADREIHLDKAKEMISEAVLGAPNDPYIIDSMGWILYRTGDYNGAVNFLERAAALRPYHMVINDHLGDAYWQVGRKIEAYYMWQRALDYYDDSDEEQQRMIDETRRKVKEGL